MKINKRITQVWKLPEIGKWPKMEMLDPERSGRKGAHWTPVREL